MNEIIIDYNEYSQERPHEWQRKLIRRLIKSCKDGGISQRKTVIEVNKLLKLADINEEINLSRVRYYWKDHR